MTEPVRDEDWVHGVQHGYRPYHLHMSYEDYGVPQDEAVIALVAEGAVKRVQADGFNVWPDAMRIDYDGERIIVEVLVKYGGPGDVSGWLNVPKEPE